MNHHELTKQMDKGVSTVASDNPNKGQKLAEFVNPAKNSVGCAVYAGDQYPLNLLKPQTTVYREADDIQTDEPADTEADDIQIFKTKRHISRYRPGEVETAVLRPELNLIDIETPAVHESAVFIGDLKASAEYAVRIAPTIIKLAPTYDALVVVKNSQLTDTELQLLRESLGKFRELRDGELPLFYLHQASGESDETLTAQYEANVEKLKKLQLPGDIEAFRCETFDASDAGVQAFRTSWTTVVETQRDVFVNKIWTRFVKEIKDVKAEYSRLLERMNGYTDFQEKVARYQEISSRGHPIEALTRAWEDVNHSSRYQVSREFSGNNGKATLYDIALNDVPESGDTAVWDEWSVVKSSEILQAFLSFMIDIEKYLHQEYVRVRRETIEQFIEELSTAGITTEAYPALVCQIRSDVDKTLKLRELSASTLTATEAWFRYGFMIYLLGSLTLTTVSAMAVLMASLKSGAEASQVASPLGPVAAIAAFSIGAIIGVIVSKKMIDSQNAKAYRVEANQQLSRLLGAVQTEALSARDTLWIEYKRVLEDQRKEIQTAINVQLTEESKAYQDLKLELENASPDKITMLRNQKISVIEALEEVLAANEESAEESASEEDDENSV